MVYVDAPRHRLGRMIMCHMAADSIGELHMMADAIGVSRRHFQDGKRQHYDICKAKRSHAVRLGAREISSREMVRLFSKPTNGGQ